MGARTCRAGGGESRAPGDMSPRNGAGATPLRGEFRLRPNPPRGVARAAASRARCAGARLRRTASRPAGACRVQRRGTAHRRGAVGNAANDARHARPGDGMNVVIFDYGAGNLHSLAKALASAGVTDEIDTDPDRKSTRLN